MQYIKQFENYLQTLGYHPVTVRGHLYHVASYLKWEQQGNTVDQYKSYLESKPNKRYGGGISVSHIYSNLKSVELYFNFQLEMGIIERNPMSSVVLPRRKYAQKHLASEKEIKALYKACESYFERCLLSIFYGCGLRCSEGINLAIGDINLGEHYLVVRNGKGAKRRVVPLSPGVRADIQNYIHYERKAYGNQKEEPLLLNAVGTKLKGQVANKYLKRIVERSGQLYLLPSAHLHWLRFLLGCHLLDRGMNIEEIQKMLGHSSLETTGKYYTRVRQNKVNTLSVS